MAELLGKIFQTIDLRMFIELKREVGKVKKIMYELNGYIINEINTQKQLKRNPGA